MGGPIVYPFNFVNRDGIPLVESSAVTVTTENAVIAISNNAFRFLGDKGLILFRLNQAIPADGAALPVILSWTSNFNQQLRTQPLTLVGGEAATGEQLTGAGVYLIYYNKCSNLLQLMMTFGPTTTVAANTNTGN